VPAVEPQSTVGALAGILENDPSDGWRIKQVAAKLKPLGRLFRKLLFMRHFFGLLLLPILPLLTAATVSQQPTSKWQVDYGETQCVALRSYGDRILAFRIAPDDSSYELILLEPGVSYVSPFQFDATVGFAGGEIKTTALMDVDRSTKNRRITFRLNASQIESMRTSNFIHLTAVGRDAWRKTGSLMILRHDSAQADFAMSQLAGVLTELHKCTVELRRVWNYGPNAVVKVAQSSRGDLRPLFSSDDYPTAALERDREGETQLMLLVNEQGKVVNCYNLIPSNIASIDAMSCAVVIIRAKFEPARDAQGNAIKDLVVSPLIRFQLRS
jgi:hypothetical protein